MYKDFNHGDLTVRLCTWADDIVRVRVSRDFLQTYNERYEIITPAVECGEQTESGVKTGGLEVSFDGEKITFITGGKSREIRIFDSDSADVKKYFCEKLNNMRPDPKRILGDEAKKAISTVDFQTDPKSIKFPFGGERLYGLGEGDYNDILLNGKTVLGRVIYVDNEIPVPFVMSSGGWGVLLNSTVWYGVDLGARNDGELCWYLPDGEIDFFVFGGGTLKGVLERCTAVSGRPALLPKWGYGLTFVEQYKADQFEVMRTASKFRELNLPVDMISLEPGWMETEYDFSTQKRWNIDRFYICDWMRHDKPGLQTFPAALNRYGFHLALWLCCNYDFTAEAENRAGNKTDFGFEPWFEHLKQFVNDGASGFKMDPCRLVDSANEQRIYANGRPEFEMHNLTQTLYAKQMYEGFTEHTGLRPMTHFCGGYTGTNKYVAATTGDSGGGFKTLVWMLNLGMSGFSNTTCDMNTFDNPGMHYGFFTAWAQLNSWSGFRYPWWSGDEQQAIFTTYDRLRYRLMPYLYSAAINAHITGTPIDRAMPLEFDDDRLYNCKTQFMFGDSFLISVFGEKVMLPRGCDWIDYWSKKKYPGGAELDYDFPKNCGGPLFVKAGAIIPMQPERRYTSCKDEPVLTLEVYPASESSYTLYEDDGLSLKSDAGERAETHFACRTEGDIVKISIGERKGSFEGIGERRWEIRCACEFRPLAVKVNGSDVDFEYLGGFAEFAAPEGSEAEIFN